MEKTYPLIEKCVQIPLGILTFFGFKRGEWSERTLDGTSPPSKQVAFPFSYEFFCLSTVHTVSSCQFLSSFEWIHSKPTEFTQNRTEIDKNLQSAVATSMYSSECM